MSDVSSRPSNYYLDCLVSEAREYADHLKAKDVDGFTVVQDLVREIERLRTATEPCVRECETCDGPLPPLDEWSMPSCPECVKLADERNELISELENISSYEAGAAQDIIKRAIAALRDDHLRSLRDGGAAR